MEKNTNRRGFLKQTAALTAGVAVMPSFNIISGLNLNSRVNIAMIGAGNIARMAYNGCVGEKIVALADVDSNMFPTKLENHPKIHKAKRFTDFRVMLDKMEKKIDAVCVNTPDHTHFVATMDAMQRGMHVCTQKPLVHNIWQARTLKLAKEKYGVITNMAVQGHTYNGIKQFKEWVEADVLGQVREIHCWRQGPAGKWLSKEDKIFYWKKPNSFPPEADPVPQNLNYDLWLGPVPETPFNATYHPLSWRGYHAFGNGMFGDWFPHIGDAPVWAFDLYDPISAELIRKDGGNEWVVPDSNVVKLEFARRGDKAPCTLYWYNGDPSFMPKKPEAWPEESLKGASSMYIGDKNSATTNPRSDKPRLIGEGVMEAFLAKGGVPEKYPRIQGGPFQEWIRAIKGEGPEPGANFDFASPFTETTLIGVLAARFGGKIEWDAKSMKITNRPELNQYIKEPVRAGWEYGDDLWE